MRYFLLAPVAGCLRLTTGLYPKSLSMKNTISSSRIRISLLQTELNHFCIAALTLISSSSVPAPAAVSGAGTAGTKASGFEAIRCSWNLMNSLCVRRMSRNWVVRNLGRFVLRMVSKSPEYGLQIAYVCVKPQDWVLLPRALQARDFALQLVLRAWLLLLLATVIALSFWPALIVHRWRR